MRSTRRRGGTVVIVRTVTFAAEVRDDDPAILVYQAEGGVVPASLLPAELLGRAPEAITSSTWHLEDTRGRGPRRLVTVNPSA